MTKNSSRPVPNDSIMQSRPGYKNTKLGWIPVDWQVVRLEDITSKKISYGIVQAGPHVPDGQPYIKSSDLRGDLRPDSLQRTSDKIAKKYKRSTVRPGDIVFSLRGDVGVSALVPDYLPIANLTQGTARITSTTNDNKFLALALQQSNVNKRIQAVSKGSTFREISLADLRRIRIPLPPLQEQQRIATLLTTWYHAITTTQALITQLEARKRGLMQRLLTGEVRLPGFEGEWNKVPFGKIFKPHSEKCGDREFEVLSVTKDGIVSQSDYFDKSIASRDTSSYKVVRRGELAMSGLNFWMGALDVLHTHDVGIISPAYKVFKISHERVDVDYVKALVRSSIMKKALIGASVQGASIVRRNLDKEMLMSTTFDMPSKDEQIAIARILTRTDLEIDLYTKRLCHLKSQKRGLMQQLLTGHKRLLA